MEEPDYSLEAGHQKRFASSWAGVPSIRIRTVFPECSSRSILTQSFEPSPGLLTIRNHPEEARRACALELSRFFVSGIFERCLIHTDLHPRNWGFRPQSGLLVVYDFGSVLELDFATANGLRDLLRRASESSSADLVHAYAAIGFDPEALSRIEASFPVLSRLLLEPLLKPQSV